MGLLSTCRSTASAASATGTVVSTSKVAEERSSGSTSSRYRNASASSPGCFPYAWDVRVVNRSTSTSRGALSSTIALNRGENRDWFSTVPETNNGPEVASSAEIRSSRHRR